MDTTIENIALAIILTYIFQDIYINLFIRYFMHTSMVDVSRIELATSSRTFFCFVFFIRVQLIGTLSPLEFAKSKFLSQSIASSANQFKSLKLPQEHQKWQSVKNSHYPLICEFTAYTGVKSKLSVHYCLQASLMVKSCA